MDTNKEYIKMCEKAEEIQDSYPDYGLVCEGRNIFYERKIEGVKYCDDNNEPYFYSKYRQLKLVNNIWLPRQDQLQDMIANKFVDYVRDIKFNSTLSLMYNFWKFVDDECEDSFSIERAWLAFVMKEKYNKIWNGKEWEIIK